MQPYFFPYLGYYQLINKVDRFVIYDDVNFIKGGWINRNRILINNQVSYINLPILGASSFKKINEILVGKEKSTTLNKLKNSYSRAPYFSNIFPLISEIINHNSENLGLYLGNSIHLLSRYLDINTEFVYSSNIEKKSELKGQDKVIEICRLNSASTYYNSIGGKDLYSKDVFLKNKIGLKFLKCNFIEYKQFGNSFISNLSILDVLMFNSKDEIKNYLLNFEIL